MAALSGILSDFLMSTSDRNHAERILKPANALLLPPRPAKRLTNNAVEGSGTISSTQKLNTKLPILKRSNSSIQNTTLSLDNVLKWREAFKNLKIYFDGVDHSLIEKLKPRIQKMGGVKFFKIDFRAIS
jgi:hypothetical protein